LLLLLVLGGIAAAYFLTRDDSGSATKVPNVVGEPVAQALRELGQHGYAPVVRGRTASGTNVGTVLAEDPPAGTELDRGSQVTITVARGPGTVDVPNVVGLSVAAGFERLQQAGLKGDAVKVASNEPKDQVLKQRPPARASVPDGTTVVLTVSRGPAAAGGSTVPDVRGLTQASATATLTRLGLNVSSAKVTSQKPAGIVVSQTPAPGTKATKGSTVALKVSGGPAATTQGTTTKPPPSGTKVPNVVGMGQLQAVTRLEGAGFRVNSYPVDSSRTRGTVVRQRPAAGARAAAKSIVNIDVALGSGARPLRVVPDVRKRPEKEARHTLVNVGFTVRSIDRQVSDPAQVGIVLDQRPTAGDRASAGSQIVIYVGRAPSATG
jgi:serine/threonine-protein kinase